MSADLRARLRPCGWRASAIGAVVAFAIAAPRAHGEPADAPDPYALTAAASPRFAPTVGTFGRASLGFSRQWWDRLDVGARVSLGAASELLVTEELVELGVWLHPSKRLDLLLAWRAGHSYYRFGLGAGRSLGVQTFLVETTAELAFHLAARTELRVAPLVVSVYRHELWQINVGPELGIARRF